MAVAVSISPLRGHVLDSENKILPPPRIRTIYSLRRPVFRGQAWKKENVTQLAKIFKCAIKSFFLRALFFSVSFLLCFLYLLLFISFICTFLQCPKDRRFFYGYA